MYNKEMKTQPNKKEEENIIMKYNVQKRHPPKILEGIQWVGSWARDDDEDGFPARVQNSLLFIPPRNENCWKYIKSGSLRANGMNREYEEKETKAKGWREMVDCKARNRWVIYL